MNKKENFLKKSIRSASELLFYLKNKGDVKKIFLENNFELSHDRKKIIKKILKSYHEQKEIQKKVSSIYKPGKIWGATIRERYKEYSAALENMDIAKLNNLFANFFRNNGVSGLWSIAYFEDICKSSFPKKIRFVNAFLKNFNIWKKLINKDIKELTIPNIGNPWGYKIKNVLILPNSFTHYYYLTRIANLTSEPKKPLVCEIGAGYGGFAYYLLSKKFCTYLNFDLPEPLLISSYFLMNAFPEKRVLLFNKNMYGKKIRNIEKYDIILMPNYMFPFLDNNSADIVVNTHSLSEMDYETVKEYMKQISRISKKYFYHVNSYKPIRNYGGNLEINAENIIPDGKWNKVFSANEPWHGCERYREYLYRKFLEHKNTNI